MEDTRDVPIRRALVSVFDKTGLDGFAKSLHGLGVEIVSTGGTATYIRDLDIPVIPVSEVTGFPEVLEGRVKTLHPAIHGGLLADLEKPGHRAALATHEITPIGLVAVNLYPFESVASDASKSVADVVENIDIGGVALLRAAAKNYARVTTLSDFADYDAVVEEMERRGGATSLATRHRLAAKTFAVIAAYDSAIANWFSLQNGERPPSHFIVSGALKSALRYGENPHQTAALYATSGRELPNLTDAEQVQGKELSYNNIADADAAFELISEFAPDVPAAVIVKHANPCGAALGATLAGAYGKALACDPDSAFGGIVALNGTIDEDTAHAILKVFTEVVLAPAATAAAREVFASKPNVRLLLTGGLLPETGRTMSVRGISGGFLVQAPDISQNVSLRTMTARAPTEEERSGLVFAMRVAKHVRSNAIVFAKGGATLGIGAGQMSRVDSVRLAIAKAQNAAKAANRDPESALAGSVVASDAFFPFADGLTAAAGAGAVAVIQPGGSMRDEEVIAAADACGIAMTFTGIRHFRH